MDETITDLTMVMKVARIKRLEGHWFIVIYKLKKITQKNKNYNPNDEMFKINF